MHYVDMRMKGIQKAIEKSSKRIFLLIMLAREWIFLYKILENGKVCLKKIYFLIKNFFNRGEVCLVWKIASL